MTDPHTSVLGAAAWAGSVSVLAGTVLGLPTAALVFGLAGGLAALKLEDARAQAVPQRGLWARVTTAALGTVTAAAAAHPVTESVMPSAAWLPVVALVIGAGAELLLREGLRAVVHRIRQLGGTEGGST